MRYTGWKKRLRDFLVRCLARVYRVTVSGLETLPPTGSGVLLVCNHVSYVDAIVLQLACPRTIRFLSFEEFFRWPLLGAVLKGFNAIPISSRHAKDAVVKASEVLKQGEVVCIFPEGRLTLTGELQEFQKGFELIARRGQVPVLPVHLGSLWESIFSYQGGHPFWKWPRHIPLKTHVTFGVPIPFEEANVQKVRQEVVQLGRDVRRKIMNEPLKKELEQIRAQQKVLLENLMVLDQQLRRVSEKLEAAEKPEVPAPVLPPPLPVFKQDAPPTSLFTPDTPFAHVPEVSITASAPLPKTSVQTPVEETSVSPESPEHPQTKDSFEFRLGQVWLIRLGILLFLTGMVFLGSMAYQNFITKLPPIAKAFGLYAISGVLVGLGLVLERWKESLKNFGQVILGGGLAAVYYTTYASHFVPQLRWIESLAVAAVLLLGCASVITWMADWKKSQTLGTMGLLLAYYSCVINPVSWFTLLSNLLLGTAALFLLVRNRWSICSWLALPATYGAYSYWQFFKGGAEASGGGFWMSAAFLSAYWLLFTGGIFLCRSGQCSDENKASFLSLNNISFYVLMLFSLPRSMHEPWLWMGTMAYGILLTGLGILASVKIKEGPAVCHAFIIKGLLFITAGIFLRFTGYQLAMVIALQSAVLLLAARDPFRLLLRCAAGVLAFVALVTGMAVFSGKNGQAAYSGLFISVVFLFQAWWERKKRWQNGLVAQDLYGPSFYYVILAMIASLTVGVVNLPYLWKAPVLAGLALVLTLFAPRLRLPELSVGAQSFLWTALGVWFWQYAERVQPAGNMLAVLASALILSYWWQNQKRINVDDSLVQAGIFFSALGSVVMVYLQFDAYWNDYQWMQYGGLLAFVALLYALVFRNWAIALFSQAFLVTAAVHFLGKVTAREVDWLPALVPLASVLAMNLALKTLWERKGDEVSGGWSLLVLGPAVLVYRLLTMFMSLFWVHAFIPDVYLPGFLGAMGTLCVVWALQPFDRLRYGFGLLLIVGGLVFYWLDPVRNVVTRWSDLVVILAPAFIQQVNKRWMVIEGKGRWQEVLEILLTVGSLWVFTGNCLSRLEGGFYLTISWSVLALVVFGFGLLLQERTYRLAGLFILAATVGRIVFVDMWQFGALSRILSLMVCGTVLGVLGFIYNRYAETIKKYL